MAYLYDRMTQNAGKENLCGKRTTYKTETQVSRI